MEGLLSMTRQEKMQAALREAEGFVRETMTGKTSKLNAVLSAIDACRAALSEDRVVAEPVAWRYRPEGDLASIVWSYATHKPDLKVKGWQEQPLYLAPPDSAPSGEAVREAFRYADEQDWDYVISLLQNNVRHWQDSQTGFWITVLTNIRKALTAPGASVGEDRKAHYDHMWKVFGWDQPSDPTPQDAKDVRPAPNTEAGMMYEEEMLKGRIKMSIPAQDAKADALTKWQQDDIAEWAKRWHWRDCEENHADRSVYPRDLRLLAAFRKVFLPPSASKPVTVEEIARDGWKLVPIVPSWEMRKAGQGYATPAGTYAAMLASAPHAPGGEHETE